MDTDYKTRVEAGMAWLDDFKPGWERDVDFATLDLANGCDCVLGQTLREKAGVYLSGFNWAINNVMNDEDAYYRGFLGSSHDDYDALEAEWRTAIKARFDTGVLSDDVVRGA